MLDSKQERLPEQVDSKQEHLPEQVDKFDIYRTMFRNVNPDSDGSLSISQIHMILLKMDIEVTYLELEKFARKFTSMEGDTLHIDIEEFVTLMKENSKTSITFNSQ